MIRLENDQPHCLDCADLGHLEFLGRGNTALTRRATKHSPLRAVVVEWSRARQRYERQGILVTGEAIDRAERECLADEEIRASQRERAAVRREEGEAVYEAAVTAALRAAFPGCPPEEAERIGLYNRVVAADELSESTRELATRLAKGPTFAIAMTKEMLNREMDVSLETGLEWEAQAQATCMQHPDYREAYDAFVEKREPRFGKW
jgi:hypothetical protein